MEVNMLMKLRKKEGFTLIEIIAVLLILAVLAAVAIPRYLNLVDNARTRALDGALAASYSQLSLSYAQLALQDGVPPVATAVADNATPEGEGFTYGFVGNDGAGTVAVTVTEVVDSGTPKVATGTWTLP